MFGKQQFRCRQTEKAVMKEQDGEGWTRSRQVEVLQNTSEDGSAHSLLFE